MKSKFAEYYPLEAKVRDSIWEKGTLVIDTNVLLNLYRYTPDTRDNFLNILDHYKDRLWMPYQVGFEYHNNRLKVINDLFSSYDTLIERIGNFKKSFINDLRLSDFSKHPFFKKDFFQRSITAYTAGLIKEVNKWKESTPKYMDDDSILNKLTALYEGKIGEDYDDEKMRKLYSEGKTRYEKQIPPGYKDLKNKKEEGERHIYGDLIIWKMVMDQSKNSDCDIVLVTDDLKDDWWYKLSGKTISARYELLSEFKKETNHKILIYDATQFLTICKDKGVGVEEKAIKEVKEVQKAKSEIPTSIFSAVAPMSGLSSHLFSSGSNRQAFLSKDYLVTPMTTDGSISGLSDTMFGRPVSANDQIILNSDYLASLGIGSEKQDGLVHSSYSDLASHIAIDKK